MSLSSTVVVKQVTFVSALRVGPSHFHIYVCVCIDSQSGSDTYRLERICRSLTADSPRYIWGFSHSSLPPPSRHWSHLSFVFWTAAARWSSEPASASEARENIIRAPHAWHWLHSALTHELGGKHRCPPIGRRPLPYIITGSVTQQKWLNKSGGMRWQRWHVRSEGLTRWQRAEGISASYLNKLVIHRSYEN